MGPCLGGHHLQVRRPRGRIVRVLGDSADGGSSRIHRHVNAFVDLLVEFFDSLMVHGGGRVGRIGELRTGGPMGTIDQCFSTRIEEPQIQDFIREEVLCTHIGVVSWCRCCNEPPEVRHDFECLGEGGVGCVK